MKSGEEILRLLKAGLRMSGVDKGAWKFTFAPVKILQFNETSRQDAVHTKQIPLRGRIIVVYSSPVARQVSQNEDNNGDPQSRIHGLDSQEILDFRKRWTVNNGEQQENKGCAKR